MRFSLICCAVTLVFAHCVGAALAQESRHADRPVEIPWIRPKVEVLLPLTPVGEPVIKLSFEAFPTPAPGSRALPLYLPIPTGLIGSGANITFRPDEPLSVGFASVAPENAKGPRRDFLVLLPDSRGHYSANLEIRSTIPDEPEGGMHYTIDRDGLHDVELPFSNCHNGASPIDSTSKARAAEYAQISVRCGRGTMTKIQDIEEPKNPEQQIQYSSVVSSSNTLRIKIRQARVDLPGAVVLVIVICACALLGIWPAVRVWLRKHWHLALWAGWSSIFVGVGLAIWAFFALPPDQRWDVVPICASVATPGGFIVAEARKTGSDNNATA